MESVISSIDWSFEPGDTFAQGLKRVRMKSLGRIVVLAGPNGSGKTRLLNLVQRFTNGEFQRSPVYVSQYGNGIQSIPRDQIRGIMIPGKVDNTMPAREARAGDAATARATFSTDASNFPATIPQACVTLQALAEDFLDGQNPALNLEPIQAQSRTEPWEQACKIIEVLLGLKPDFNFTKAEGNYVKQALLNGRPIDHVFGEFSPGQKRLFGLAVPLAGRNQNKQRSVLMFDEPETSLHPEAAINMIHRLVTTIPDGQLWIATHSLPLIAGLGVENVWYAEDGTISYGGRRTERVIKSLMGGNENIFALREAISEPDRAAMSRFAAQCLGAPTVVADAAEGDGQMKQFVAGMGEQSGRAKSVLDWGCGKGRLKLWLERFRSSDEFKVDYVGYERDPAVASEANENIMNAARSNADCVFSDFSSIENAAKDRQGFDVVLLANVIHEVPPEEWRDLLVRLTSVLAESGHIIILEDSKLPVGELPHMTGFLILDHQACAELFGGKGEEIVMIEDATHEPGRLLAFAIPKCVAAAVSEQTVKVCVETIQSRCMALIEKANERALQSHSEKAYDEGHRHALAVMQFANATLALKRLSIAGGEQARSNKS